MVNASNLLVLLRFGEEVSPYPRLLSTISEIFVMSGLRSVVAKILVKGNFERVEETVVISCEDTWLDGVLVSSTEEVFKLVLLPELVLLIVDLSEFVRLRIAAESFSAQVSVVDVSKLRSSANVVVRKAGFVLPLSSVCPNLVGEVESFELNSVVKSGDTAD